MQTKNKWEIDDKILYNVYMEKSKIVRTNLTVVKGSKMIKYLFDGKDAVICLDIGGSECSGFVLRRVTTEHHSYDSLGKVIATYVDVKFHSSYLNLKNDSHNIDTVLYRYMTRSGEQTVIGTPSDRDGDVNVQNFKSPPPYKGDAGWDRIHPSSTDPEKTYRYYMHLFLRALWENIRRYNSGDEGVLKNIPDDRIAIYVGCPASENWTAYTQRKQYEQLISEATGIKAVRVVPESTAGVFRAVDQRKSTAHPIDPKSGILVIDVGSCTLDSTYMKMGDVLIENSWTLGASAIEANLQRYIDSQYTDADTDPAAQQNRLYQLRKLVKERYYDATNRLSDLLANAEEYNPENYIESIDRDSVAFDFTDTALLKRIRITSELIDKALSLPVYGVCEGGKPKSEASQSIPQGLSWKEYFSLFLKRNIAILEEKYCDVDYVILTGGASRMYFIRDLCLAEFTEMEKRRRDGGKIMLFIDPNPSDSVGYGLIRTARNDYEVTETYQKLFEKSRNSLRLPLTKLTNRLRDVISDEILTVYERFLCTCPEKMLREDFEQKLKAYLSRELSSDSYKRLFTKELEALKSELISRFCEFSKEISKKMYGDDDTFCVPDDTVASLVVSEISTLNKDIASLDLSNLVGKYSDIIAGSLLILSFVPLAAIQIGLLLFDTVVEIFSDDDPKTASRFADWYISNIEKLAEPKVNTRKQQEKLQSTVGRHEIREKIASPIAKSNIDSVLSELFGEKREKYDDMITKACHRIVTYTALIDFPERHSY